MSPLYHSTLKLSTMKIFFWFPVYMSSWKWKIRQLKRAKNLQFLNLILQWKQKHWIKDGKLNETNEKAFDEIYGFVKVSELASNSFFFSRYFVLLNEKKFRWFFSLHISITVSCRMLSIHILTTFSLMLHHHIFRSFKVFQKRIQLHFLLKSLPNFWLLNKLFISSFYKN